MVVFGLIISNLLKNTQRNDINQGIHFLFSFKHTSLFMTGNTGFFPVRFYRVANGYRENGIMLNSNLILKRCFVLGGFRY
jgi:hypothetical protein